MAARIATFSDGTTDTYKGTRDIRAAWAIFERDTGVFLGSGHSLDMQRAKNTAVQTARRIAGTTEYGCDVAYAERPTRRLADYQRAQARAAGFETAREHYAAYTAARDAVLKTRLRIEVVPVG